MKIYALYLYARKGQKLELVDSSNDFSDIGMMHRKYAIEICDFAAYELANGENKSQNVSAQQQDYLVSMFRATPDIAAVIATDKDYPSRASFSILRNVANEYQQNGNSFPGGKSNTIRTGIVQFQNPTNADKILKIQANLAETQQIMVTTLEMAIARGQSISEMADKSEQLSKTSQLFLRDSKKLNSCCSMG